MLKRVASRTFNFYSSVDLQMFLPSILMKKKFVLWSFNIVEIKEKSLQICIACKHVFKRRQQPFKRTSESKFFLNQVFRLQVSIASLQRNILRRQKRNSTLWTRLRRSEFKAKPLSPSHSLPLLPCGPWREIKIQFDQFLCLWCPLPNAVLLFSHEHARENCSSLTFNKTRWISLRFGLHPACWGLNYVMFV